MYVCAYGGCGDHLSHSRDAPIEIGRPERCRPGEVHRPVQSAERVLFCVQEVIVCIVIASIGSIITRIFV